MELTEKVVWKVYIGVVGAGATFAAQKLLTFGWKQVTGEEPPSPTDPETPWARAVIWALASGVGVGAAQLISARLAAKHFNRHGRTAPGLGKVKINM